MKHSQQGDGEELPINQNSPSDSADDKGKPFRADASKTAGGETYAIHTGTDPLSMYDAPIWSKSFV